MFAQKWVYDDVHDDVLNDDDDDGDEDDQWWLDTCKFQQIYYC